ncbi:MAG: hypothetical protein ABR569_08635 [Gaiellaceae bacterium]
MRERWFGATGTRVPEIAVEGELELGDALVLEAADDATLREAFDEGRPVAVRASTPEAVRAALERPEVAVALVPPERRELLDLDLTDLTYG